MKTNYKTSILLMLAIVIMASSSCSKKATPTPAPTDISLVVGAWSTNYWGNVEGDDLSFSVVKSTATATVTGITGNGYGFATGDVIFSNITPNADGTYSCSASYSPTGSGLSTRNATMSLQNSNTQLTVFYPAINSSFPAITYIFTKQIP